VILGAPASLPARRMSVAAVSYGVRRQAKRDAAFLCFVLQISGLRHHPKRRRASLAAALHIF